MKTIFRFTIGYFIGTLIVVIISLQRGDFPDVVARALLIGLLFSTVIAVLTIVILKLLNIISLIGVVELSGLCIGLFSLMFCIWPTGFLLIIECIVLSMVISTRLLIFRI